MNAGRLSVWQHLAIFALVVAAIISRRPDAILNPQFYAEDGAIWYADAWNLGWLHSLAITGGSYLNTLPRLTCGLAILVPLKLAPLLLNCFGILIQALPVNVMLSARCGNWGPLWLRGIQSALYVALPNSNELDVTITNAHWHLALVACLIGFGDPPSHMSWKVFDVAVILLVGLTGPWALVLAPLLAVYWLCRKQAWSLILAVLMAGCALLQFAEIVTHLGDRPQTPLGATPYLFLRLIAGQVYTAALWGKNSLAERAPIITAVLIFTAGTFVILYALIKLRLEMKIFTAFAILVTTAALRSPLIFGDQPRWRLLALDKGGRYWFFPMLALLWSLVWIASQKQRTVLRVFSVACLLLLLRGIPRDWKYWPFKDEHFARYTQTYKDAPRGTMVTIPIYPDGHQMVLIKK